MHQDFDLVKDIQSDHFNKISTLFSNVSSEIHRTLGKLEIWRHKGFTEALIREMYYFIQIGETINKLALIHSENFEELQMSFDLGVIIRNNVNSLLSHLPFDVS